MSKNIREQFEEAVDYRNSFDMPMVRQDILPKILTDLESISDTQAIELAKWIVLNGWTRVGSLGSWYKKDATNRDMWSSEALLAQFKKEYYNQLK